MPVISLMIGMWSLIHTQPAAISAAVRWARNRSCVHAEAASRCSAVARSAGVAPAQPGNAAFAAATASSTSPREA